MSQQRAPRWNGRGRPARQGGVKTLAGVVACGAEAHVSDKAGGSSRLWTQSLWGRLSGAGAAQYHRVSLDRSSAVRAMEATKGSAHSNETAEANVVSPLFCRLVMSVSSTCYRHQCYEAWKSGFVRKNGCPARDYEDTVTEQLSALASRLVLDEAPNADFSAFSSFGKRALKLMTCWAQIIVGGELTTKTVPVLPRFCTVAKMLAGVDNHAEIGRLATRPTGHLRGGHPTAPQHCGHLSVVADRIRSERWVMLKGRVESLVQKSQFQGSWNPDRPWAAAVAHSACGRGDVSWWFSQVDKPCLQSPSVRGSTALRQILEGGMPTLSDVYDGTSRAGGRTPGQKRNKRDSYLTKRSTAARRPLPQRWKLKTSVLHLESA